MLVGTFTFYDESDMQLTAEEYISKWGMGSFLR